MLQGSSERTSNMRKVGFQPAPLKYVVDTTNEVHFHAEIGSKWDDQSAGRALLVRLDRFGCWSSQLVEESLSFYVCVASSGFTSAAVTEATGENIDPGLQMRSAGTLKVKRSEEQRRPIHHSVRREWRKASAAPHWRRNCHKSTMFV